MITQEIKDFLNLQKLGYVATVSSDGKPNISPKGTIIGWTTKTLAFADIRSPDTMKNLQDNPNVEINVIDPLLRKGYLFQGVTKTIENGDTFTKNKFPLISVFTLIRQYFFYGCFFIFNQQINFSYL